METSKQYNSVPVKDNCALFAPTSLFLGPDYSMVSLKFFSCRPLLPSVAIATNFGTKIDYFLAAVKDRPNCALFAPSPPLLIHSC